jgi:glycine cleavage system H protein
MAEVNGALSGDAGVINQDPYGNGWIIKVQTETAPGALMDASAYKGIS